MRLVVFCLLLLPVTVTAFRPAGITTATTRTTTSSALRAEGIDTSFMWNAGLSFGKGPFAYYQSFSRMMSVFPEEDRSDFPNVFTLPTGLREISLVRPLGIVFEEIEAGRGLRVEEIVENGNAAKADVLVGDLLVGITAVKIVGAKYERRMIPARNFDFDTMVGAISSNEPKWSCDDVVLLLERPTEADAAKTDQFMSFFEPPFDNPWKQRQ